MRVGIVVCIGLSACAATRTGTIASEEGEGEGDGAEREPPECPGSLPLSTVGLIGDAEVTLDFSAAEFTTTFTHEGTTYTSHGDATYLSQYAFSLVLSASAGIDEECLGQPVIYSFSWSDDCSAVGLTRDTDLCETRVNNLEGVTLYTR
jgi:hypothetical protein